MGTVSFITAAGYLINASYKPDSLSAGYAASLRTGKVTQLKVAIVSAPPVLLSDQRTNTVVTVCKILGPSIQGAFVLPLCANPREHGEVPMLAGTARVSC